MDNWFENGNTAIRQYFCYNSVMGRWIHKIIEKDIGKMKGICANCGNVKLILYQKKYHMCENSSTVVKVSEPRRKLGVTSKQSREFDIQIKKQGVCKICSKRKKLLLDHNHKTRVIRGFICLKCNLGLGYFNDDVEILKSAIEYLKEAKK